MHSVCIVFGCGFCLQSRLCWHTAPDKHPDTDARLARSCVYSPQPTFVRDQFKALRLPSPLPFPELHLQGEYSLSGEVDHSSDRRNRRCTQQNHCPSALLISSISPQSALHILSSRHIFTALSLNPCGKLYLCSASVPCVMPPLRSRHVNKLMTLVFKKREKSPSHIPLRHLMVYSHHKGKRPGNAGMWAKARMELENLSWLWNDLIYYCGVMLVTTWYQCKQTNTTQSVKTTKDILDQHCIAMDD